MKLDIIVVVYNHPVDSLKSILTLRDSDTYIHICDNSTNTVVQAANERSSFTEKHVDYINMEGNKGLSKAYNEALKRCQGDVVILLDDDTQVPSNYGQKVQHYVHEHGSGIYLPIVASGTRILSPLKISGNRIQRYLNIDDCIPDQCSAFNTGMAVTRDVFHKAQYDESLFLDFVDHAFCRAAHRAMIPFWIMSDVTLQQDYSRESNDLHSALARDIIFRHDVKQYYGGTIFSRIYANLYLGYRALRNTAHYHSFSFIRQALTGEAQTA